MARPGDANDWVASSMDPVVKQLRKLGIPVTRDNYLELAYFGEVPSPLGAEQEAELPEQLQQRAKNDQTSRDSAAPGGPGQRPRILPGQ